MTTARSVAVLMAAVLVASALSGPPAFAAADAHCDLQKDLLITQSLGEPQSDGSSMYRVTVTNQCAGDERTGRPCVISRIRLQCGNFRSVIPVDPKVLRVVVPGVCLLNAGHSIPQDRNVSFVYTSYVRENLYVLSATCGLGR
ncbi:hypothetical protein VPH35_061685 [Triticum aestivum]|uniref:Uncharacterized protein n=1 Tax=Aegilops tauschii TaxID=37682 RepID=M8CEQ6_AEGTA|nr:TPD1 protein homolog 1A-like [Aegilops tauschii subsp. strangulata]